MRPPLRINLPIMNSRASFAHLLSLRKQLHCVRCGRQPHARFDKVLNLRPNDWIAFDGGVALEEEPVVPRISTARAGFFWVSEVKIADNRSARRISRDNFRAAVNYSVTLIKIDCFGDVCRNDGIILPVLSHAVYLDCQRNGNAILL